MIVRSSPEGYEGISFIDRNNVGKMMLVVYRIRPMSAEDNFNRYNFNRSYWIGESVHACCDNPADLGNYHRCGLYYEEKLARDWLYGTLLESLSQGGIDRCA